MNEENTEIVNRKTSSVDAIIIEVPSIITTKEKLLEYFKQNLRFPEYFGMNWDAFEEFMNDLSWVQETTIVICHEQLPQLPEKDSQIYAGILLAAVTRWHKDKSKKLVAIFG